MKWVKILLSGANDYAGNAGDLRIRRKTWAVFGLKATRQAAPGGLLDRTP